MKKYQRILITSDSGWKSDIITKTINYIFHEKLGFSDTLFKIKEESKKNKESKKKNNLVKKEEYRLNRAQRKLERKQKKIDNDNNYDTDDNEKEEKIKIQTKKIQTDIKNLLQKNKTSYLQNEDEDEEIDLNKSIKSKNIKSSIFIRDRKADSIIRNSLFNNIGYRIIQFRSCWENNKNAGIERNNKIFNLKTPLNLVIIFTTWKEEKNGIDHIIFLCINKNIPIIIIDNDKLKLKSFELIDNIDTEIIKKPLEKNIYIEECENKKTYPKIGSEEYKKKFNETTKKMKNMYYNSLKDKNGLIELSKKDTVYIKNKKKKKFQLQFKKSKIIKKKSKEIKKFEDLEESDYSN